MKEEFCGPGQHVVNQPHVQEYSKLGPFDKSPSSSDLLRMRARQYRKKADALDDLALRFSHSDDNVLRDSIRALLDY